MQATAAITAGTAATQTPRVGAVTHMPPDVCASGVVMLSGLVCYPASSKETRRGKVVRP